MEMLEWNAYEESTGFTARNLDVAWFGIWGSRNTSVIGGDIGPSLVGGEFHTVWITFGDHDGEPRNLLLDGVYFHDFSKAKEGDHTQCIFITGGNGVTIRNSRFVRCDVFSIFAGTPWWKQGLPPLRNVTIENNFFDASTWGGSYNCCSYANRFAGDWYAPRQLPLRIQLVEDADCVRRQGDAEVESSMIVGYVMPTRTDVCSSEGDLPLQRCSSGGSKCSSPTAAFRNLARRGVRRTACASTRTFV
jgi:hypothetical protein